MESPRRGPYLPYKPATPKPQNEPHAYNALVSLSPYNNSRSAIWRVLRGTLPPLGCACLRVRVRACACLSRWDVPSGADRHEDREDSPTH